MEHITMTYKETEQMKVFEQVKTLSLTQVAAAKKLGITDRQVRTKCKRYLRYEAQELVHKSRGRPSKAKTPEDVKTLILKLLRADWKGFKPKFVSEQLGERHGIKISRKSIRKIMKANGLWIKKEKARCYAVL